MLEIANMPSARVSKVFIILIASLLLVACASRSVAPVTDKSHNFLPPSKTHVVIPGDTLFSIAWRYGLKYEDLAKFNRISPPYIIKPSQVIRLDLKGADVVRPNSPAPSRPVKGVGLVQRASPPGLPVSSGRKENKTVKPATPKPVLAQVGAPTWRWPAKGAILSSFQGNNGLNKGIDIAGKLGEPVLAAASGQVVYAGSGLRGYGILLIIKHNETFLSAYAHNERLRVNEGDIVKAGQVIADMGSSGTDRVKLHFEIRRDGTPVDPLRYLPRR